MPSKFAVHHLTHPHKYPIYALKFSARLTRNEAFNVNALLEANGAIVGHNVSASVLEVLHYVVSSETPRPLPELS
jgi:hypothetical protein